MMAYEAENARMTSWLIKQPATLVHAVAVQLNWNYAAQTIRKIALREATDQATAAMLFLLSNPINAFPTKLGNKYVPAKHGFDEGTHVRALISYMWQGNAYAKGRIEYDPRNTDQKGFLTELLMGETQFRDTGFLPWPVLHGIEVPFHGEKPKDVLENFKDDEDETLRFLAMQEDLGVHYSELSAALRPRYFEWRVANGFGEKPSWKPD